jgi:hypothetical protein
MSQRLDRRKQNTLHWRRLAAAVAGLHHDQYGEFTEDESLAKRTRELAAQGIRYALAPPISLSER